jgi:hypothetical protein
MTPEMFPVMFDLRPAAPNWVNWILAIAAARSRWLISSPLQSVLRNGVSPARHAGAAVVFPLA